MKTENLNDDPQARPPASIDVVDVVARLRSVELGSALRRACSALGDRAAAGTGGGAALTTESERDRGAARLLEQAELDFALLAATVQDLRARPTDPAPADAPSPAPTNAPPRGGATTSLEPIPLVLTCPACGLRHVDEDEFARRPHTTHACQHCGMTFRPALVPTVGVAFLPGFRDGQLVSPEPGQAVLWTRLFPGGSADALARVVSVEGPVATVEVYRKLAAPRGEVEIVSATHVVRVGDLRLAPPEAARRIRAMSAAARRAQRETERADELAKADARAVAPCVPTRFSTRSCERGTPGCFVEHGAPSREPF